MLLVVLEWVGCEDYKYKCIRIWQVKYWNKKNADRGLFLSYYELWTLEWSRFEVFQRYWYSHDEKNGDVCIVWIRKCMTDARQRTVCSRWKKLICINTFVPCVVMGKETWPMVLGFSIFTIDNTQHMSTYCISHILIQE